MESVQNFEGVDSKCQGSICESDKCETNKKRRKSFADCHESKKLKQETSQSYAKREKKKRTRKEHAAICGSNSKGGVHETGRDQEEQVSAKSAAPHYTWFLAIQISDSSCHGGLRKAQEKMLESDPVFVDAMVPVSKSHITLFLFNLDQGGIQDAKMDDLCVSIEKAVKDWRNNKVSDDNGDAITLKLDEVGHFSNRVIFVKPHWSSVSPFPELWRSLASHLFEDGFISEPDTDFEKFKPHVTICKMSKVKRWRKQGKKLPRTFPREFQTLMADIEFGEQNVTSLQLLSMTKPPTIDPVTKGSYYHCHKEFFLTEKPYEICRPQSAIESDHKMVCQTSLSSKPNEETNNASTSPSHSTRRPWSPFSGAATAATSLLVAGGGLLLALTLARKLMK